jgi:hypothetical protein
LENSVVPVEAIGLTPCPLSASKLTFPQPTVAERGWRN